MRTLQRAVAISLLGLTMLLGSSCSSDSKEGDNTPRTTLPGTPEQLAVREAGAILEAMHEENEDFCKTPSNETNIILPERYELPLPIVRRACVYENARLQVVAFEDPADRERWMQNWTKRLCTLSNKGGVILMGASYWVVNPYTVTIVPNPATAETVKDIAGGEFKQVDCPTEDS
jgi:hypothetical protein